MGGLARRATIVESYRSTEEPLLLVDAGNVFPRGGRGQDAEIKAALGLQLMGDMGYDVLSPADTEFYLGDEFLKGALDKAPFAAVTSNLVSKDNGNSWAKPYVIKSVGGIRVAVLGIMPVDAFYRHGKRPYVERLAVTPPEDALRALVPEVRAQADVVVLLSSCGVLETARLVGLFEGINVAITCGRRGGELVDLAKIKTPVIQGALRAEKLGAFKITFSGDNTIVATENKHIPLDDAVTPHAGVDTIVKDYFTEQRRAENLAKEKAEQEALRKERKETLQLEPMEYIKRLQQQTTETDQQKGSQ